VKGLNSPNVVKFYTKDATEKPDAVLEQAMGIFQDVLILGYDHGGYLDVRSNTTLKKSEILFLMKQFETKLMRGDYDADGV